MQAAGSPILSRMPTSCCRCGVNLNLSAVPPVTSAGGGGYYPTRLADAACPPQRTSKSDIVSDSIQTWRWDRLSLTRRALTPQPPLIRALDDTDPPPWFGVCLV